MSTFHAIDAAGLLPKLCVEIDVTNLPTDSSRVWTDITTDVRSITAAQDGRNDELQRTQPGTLELVLNNTAGKYDRLNGSSVGIRRAQWIRYQAQWSGVAYARWQGIVDTVAQSWPYSNAGPQVRITASSASKVLNLFDLFNQTFAVQTTDQRFESVCTLAGLPFSADDTGQSTLVAVSTPFAKGSFALEHLLSVVEQTENGQVFADGSGTMRFQSRHFRSLNKATSSGTIGDNAGEIRYRLDAEVMDDDAYNFNSAAVTATNSDGSTGATQTSVNSVSQAQYFERQINRTLQVSDSQECQDCADFLTYRYGDPSVRVPSVTVLGAHDTSTWPKILGIGYSDRFTFTRRAASTISADFYVEQVQETVTPGESWDVKLSLSPTTDQTFWVSEDAVNGLAGTTTRGGY